MNFEDFGDFETYFWSYINENVVSDLDRTVNNTDFCESVCFDCYRIYIKSGTNIDVICKMAENLLYNVNRFKPLLGLNN